MMIFLVVLLLVASSADAVRKHVRVSGSGAYCMRSDNVKHYPNITVVLMEHDDFGRDNYLNSTVASNGSKWQLTGFEDELFGHKFELFITLECNDFNRAHCIDYGFNCRGNNCEAGIVIPVPETYYYDDHEAGIDFEQHNIDLVKMKIGRFGHEMCHVKYFKTSEMQ